MDEHNRPTVVDPRRGHRLAKPDTWVGVGVILSVLFGSAWGVGMAGSAMTSKRETACEKAEKAADLERGQCAAADFALRKEQERREQDMVLRQQQAVQECEKEGNIPLMGIDLTVVCVARVHVEWTHSLKDPAPWL